MQRFLRAVFQQGSEANSQLAGCVFHPRSELESLMEANQEVLIAIDRQK